MEYSGGRTEPDISNWIIKKSGPPSVEADCAKINKAKDDNKLVVAYFGEAAGEAFNAFQAAAGANDKYQFFHTAEKECAASFGAQMPGLVLFRKFDESPLVFAGSINKDEVNEWLSKSAVPTLIEFSEDYIEPIFGNRKAAIFLFRSNSDSEGALQKVMKEAAEKYKGEILFAVSDVKDGIQKRLAEFIGVEDSQMPTLRLLNPEANMAKFTYEKDINSLTSDDLKAWMDDFKAGKLVPFLKSQEPPVTQEDVVIVVGKTFDEIVRDPTKDVLVKFYAPWCGHCKALAPVWDELAAELKDVKDLVIAKFDSTANEVEGVDIRGYPTLKFYPRENKSGIDYEGERAKGDFVNYLAEKSSVYKAYRESKSDL